MVDTVEAIKAAEVDADDKQKAIDSFDNCDDVKSSKEDADKKLAPNNLAKRKLCEKEDEDNLSINQGKKFSSDNDEFFKSSSTYEKKTKVMEDQDDLLLEEYEYSSWCYYNGDGVTAGNEYKESAFTDKDDIAYDMVTSFDYDLSDFMY